jgi:hypothetical protein
MKRTLLASVIVLTIFSILFISETVLADNNAYLASVTIDKISGTVINNMTFDYTFTGYNPVGAIYSIQVSNVDDFNSTIVQANLTNSTQIAGVDCSSLSSGQAYCRILEGSTVISTNPTVKVFQLP